MSEATELGHAEAIQPIVCGKYSIYPWKSWDGKQSIWIEKNGGEGMELSEQSLDDIWEDKF